MNKSAILLFVFAIQGFLFAQEQKFPVPQIDFSPKGYVCYRADQFLKVDGKLDEHVWQDAEWTEYFVDIEGDSKPSPYYKTRAKMLWDDKYFYFAAEMEEPHLWGTLKQRDAVIFWDNDFEVFIDPDGDTHNYYELEVNVFKTAWDLLLRKPYRDASDVAIDSWDIQGLKVGVDARGTINNPSDDDAGWTVELAIPWSVLQEVAFKPTPPKDGDQWRVNFSRVQWELEIDNGKYKKAINPETRKTLPENNWVWSPQGIIAMHYPEMWGFVQFSYKVAGYGKDEFQFNKIENAKWAMRKFYYAQKDYHEKNKTYALGIDQLKIEEKGPEGYSWPPNLFSNGSIYEAQIINRDDKKVIKIYQDGLVKVEDL